ncbi:MAG: hypothetical protein L3J16_03930, partial [Anaerolineales bacterium]|nr:hypothetical protein [Anaerolineales bacterium]
VLLSAKAARASCGASDEFACESEEAKFRTVKNPGQDQPLSAQEVEQWLNLFSADEDEGE